MSALGRVSCLLLGLVAVAGLLPGWTPVGAAPPTGAVLPAPQWIGGTDTRGKARLVWIRNKAFTAVRVHRRDEGSPGGFRFLAETGGNLWLDDTVQPGRTYHYRLTGVGPDGTEGRPSAELTVRIGVVSLLPATPPEWEGYLVVEDGVGLKWSAREGEDVIAWNVYRRTPPETGFQLVGSARGTSYHDVGLEPGRPHVYVLTALDSSFRETTFSKELSVTVTPPTEVLEPKQPAPAWVVRRTRLVSVLGGGADLPFERPVDVAVGPLSGNVYVTDSGHNLVFSFSSKGVFQGTLGANAAGKSAFKNLLGLAIDREDNLYLADAGTGVLEVISAKGRPGRRLELPRRPVEATGLIDAAVGSEGRVYLVDNLGNQVVIAGREVVRAYGQAGARGGEFSAPTFCDVDAAGNLYVADCLNARVQVFTGAGEFVRAFGRAERGPGGFGRPKGVAVSPAGEVYVADSWLNTIQVFDSAGRFVAILGDEAGRPLDLGSPNGVALGPGRRVYIAERLAARLQIREIIDAP